MSQAERHNLPKIEAGDLTNELSAERAQGLIFKSFELSQGSNRMLIAMWSYIHLRFPYLKVSREVMQKVQDRLTPVFQKILVPHKKNPGIHGTKIPEDNTPFDKNYVGDVLETQLDSFEKILNSRSGNHFLDEGIEYTLLAILLAQVTMDYEYLVEKGGRPGDPEKKDIWDSNICKFILSNPPKNTGYSEFDQMFQEIRRMYSSLSAHPAYNGMFKKINSVIEKYNSKHPDQLVTNLV